jgi:hypothetical protein
MMTIEQLADRWNSLKTTYPAESHQLYDPEYPMMLFFGYDITGERVFFMISDVEPLNIPKTSQSISVQLYRRHDGSYSTLFRLVKPDKQSVFLHLFWDLAEASNKYQNGPKSIAALFDRYKQWQNLMEKGNPGILSQEEIKGLIGELCFLNDHFSRYHNPYSTLQGWVGPIGADRDFVYGDCWYEVKAIDVSSSMILISSLEQLDIDSYGEIVTVVLERTVPNFEQSISLNSLVAGIRLGLEENSPAQELFERKISEAGFIDIPEYSNDNFLLRNISHYAVGSHFPRIRRSMVDSAISQAKYALNLGAISCYKTDCEGIQNGN